MTYTFGNAGTLFMNAITWWDHETNSIWSQPWGRSISGAHKGVVLYLLPFQLATWESWLEDHQETMVMETNLERLSLTRRQGFTSNFVIGLVLAGGEKAYYFEDARREMVINNWIGEIHVLLYTGDDTWYAYVRQVNDRVLTFREEGEKLVDGKTGSTWDPARGLALE